MDGVFELLNWAWARHHNLLSWYIRPLFILPFCFYAYRKSAWGVGLTLVAVTSSAFWFPAPADPDPRVAAFLAAERQYVAGPLTGGKLAMLALVPLWLGALGVAFRRRAWLWGAVVIGGGTLLKIVWSFRIAGDSAWIIIPPVAVGTAMCAVALLWARSRLRQPASGWL